MTVAEPVAAPRKPRRPPSPALAAILSLLAIGTGHVYAGAIARAIVALGLAFAGLVAALACFRVAAESPVPTLAGVGILLAVQLAAAIDAARTAARRARSRAPAVRIRWVLLWAAAVAVDIELARGLVRRFVLEPFRIPSDAMLPTLLVGDHLWADKSAYRDQPPARGDVVVFEVARDSEGGVHPADQRPDLPRDRFIKRVVALPGETVEMRDGNLWINGEPVPIAPTFEELISPARHRLVVSIERLGSAAHRFADDPDRSPGRGFVREVPPERYFVLGDNRDHSNDSRYWGTVHRDDILGRATHLYLSLDPFEDRVRWERTGMRIE